MINLSSVSTLRTEDEKWRLILIINENYIQFSRSQTVFYETSNWLMPHFKRLEWLAMIITLQVTTEILGINGCLLFEKWPRRAQHFAKIWILNFVSEFDIFCIYITHFSYSWVIRSVFESEFSVARFKFVFLQVYIRNRPYFSTVVS